MISASKLMANCGYPRAIEIREAGPEHDRAKCAKKRDRHTGLPKGCRTCGRHSPRCETEGVCVICSAPRGNLMHSSIELWGKGGQVPDVADNYVRCWLETLVMTGWAPLPTDLFEMAVGLGRDGTYVPVKEVAPHVYESTDGRPLLTAGRLDHGRLLAFPVGPVLVLRDWKSGGWDVEDVRENLQLSALALAGTSMVDAVGFIREVYYLRDGRVDADPEPVLLDSDEGMHAWEAVEAAAQIDDSPRPGAHCDPCWDRRTKRCAFAQVAA